MTDKLTLDPTTSAVLVMDVQTAVVERQATVVKAEEAVGVLGGLT